MEKLNIDTQDQKAKKLLDELLLSHGYFDRSTKLQERNGSITYMAMSSKTYGANVINIIGKSGNITAGGKGSQLVSLGPLGDTKNSWRSGTTLYDIYDRLAPYLMKKTTNSTFYKHCKASVYDMKNLYNMIKGGIKNLTDAQINEFRKINPDISDISYMTTPSQKQSIIRTCLDKHLTSKSRRNEYIRLLHEFEVRDVLELDPILVNDLPFRIKKYEVLKAALDKFPEQRQNLLQYEHLKAMFRRGKLQEIQEKE